MRGRVAVLCLAIVLVAGLWAAAVPGRASEAASPASLRSYCTDRSASFSARRRFAGVNDPRLLGSDATYLACTVGRYAAGGVGFYRGPLDWASIELRPGHYDFTIYDALVAALAEHHVAYLPVLIGAPPFRRASVSPNGVVVPPARPGQFAAFAALVVRRYGPGGSFWRYYPSVPRMPVRVWQVWNEPNLTTYWWPRTDAVAYTRLLRLTYGAIKRVDPRAVVVSAGMPSYAPPGVSVLTFLRTMLRHGAVRDLDAVAFHPYAGTASGAIQRIGLVRALLDRSGSRHVPIWLTEFGWASSGPPSPFRANGPRAQARLIAEFLGLVGRERRRLRLGAVMYGAWRDQPVSGASSDYWGLHAGLWTVSLKAKSALSVFVRAARRLAG